MTFESFVANEIANEEFNPLKKSDWKDAGTAIRKGVGFLNPEEELEAGKKLVLNHPTRNKAYQQFLKENPDKANKYLQFWSKHPDVNSNPVWLEDKKIWVDRSKRYAPSGSIGAGN